MAGSALMGAATARLLVTVGYPGRGEVTRGLSGVAAALAHFRGMVNSGQHQAAAKAVSSTQAHLQKIQSVAANAQSESGSFERTHQARFISERLQQFAAASRKLKTMTSETMSQAGHQKLGISAQVNRQLFEGVKDITTEYGKLSRVAENFYSLGIEGERDLIRQLEIANAARQSSIDAIQREINLEQSSKLNKYHDPKQRAALVNEYGAEVVNRSQMNQEKEVADFVAGKQREKRAIEALMKPTTDLLNLTKNMHRATVEGEKARQTEIRSTKKILKEQLQVVGELLRQDKEWARNITQNVNQAIGNFRNVLQQSVITLTLFYYKINQVVEGIKGFQQELMNAQSIFQTTNETLYGLSNQIVEFGTQFGVSYNNAAKGLYQFASAGLSADDSMKVLNDTLKLSMAVQGDHNTISKLTTQVIFGFGLEMEDATAVTDKFAHAINKSLIEYQDLASAIKFSMPFFVSTGQSLDTLLGALQVLTNRALEAGIAGRGLRQSLAEFTQHADDNQAAFRKLGVEILDVDGNMRDLTDIAHQFQDSLGDGVSDMQIMMALMEDLNVRGATAFVHLVQNADEFSAAVKDLQNSAGSAHEMAMIQQQGLEAQMTRLKNAFLAPFLLTDEISNSMGVLNKFELVIQSIITNLEERIFEADGTLTTFAKNMREGVLQAMVSFGQILNRVLDVMVKFSDAGMFNLSMLKLYFLPLSMIVGAFEKLHPDIAKTLAVMYVLNKTLPLSIFYNGLMATSTFAANIQTISWTKGLIYLDATGKRVTWTMKGMGVAIGSAALAMAAFIAPMYIFMQISKGWSTLAVVIFGLAMAIITLMAAFTWGASAIPTSIGILAAGATMGAIMGQFSTPSGGAVDMGSYATDLNTGNSNVVSTGSNSYSPQEIYVQKLSYRESNMNQQYESTTSYQAGVTP